MHYLPIISRLSSHYHPIIFPLSSHFPPIILPLLRHAIAITAVSIKCDIFIILLSLTTKTTTTTTTTTTTSNTATNATNTNNKYCSLPILVADTTQVFDRAVVVTRLCLDIVRLSMKILFGYR